MDFSTIDGTSVEGYETRPDSPDEVKGRILHHDSDFLAYQCGYKWETESLAVSIEHLRKAIQTCRIMAGAEFIFLYLTMGDKGGRNSIATVKEYQAQRAGRDPGLTKRVKELREFMATCTDPGVTPKVQMEQEADDALCQAMQAARSRGQYQLNVLQSADKDLWMVGGLHVNAKTYEIEDFPFGYGQCDLDINGTRKKLVGRGTSFFWHQLLMGDTADNIPGLPEFSTDLVLEYWPTKAICNARDKIKSCTSSGQSAKAKKSLSNLIAKVKPKKVGAVGAYEYLYHCKTDRQAMVAVLNAYREYYGDGAFTATHWNGSQFQCTAGAMLVEQAQLLWMRRTEGEDVITFFEDI
jgi:hypothetical protein